MAKNEAQKKAEAIIKKYGGKQIKHGKDKGKWDMKKGVKEEREKGGKGESFE